MLAYLSMMAPRLLELRRVLKPEGSLFLHCDPTASHYLKLLMDSTFGAACFRNEIAWCYYGPGSPGIRQFLRKHDTVLWYSKSPDKWTFNRDAVRVPHSSKTQENFKRGHLGSGFAEDVTLGDGDALHSKGKVPEDWWIMAIAARSTKERLGYPTQKPLALLDRIIRAASNPGDLVLDPFCGCGTTIAAAEALGRKWIGIDLTALAISLIKSRLTAAGASDYTVLGEPTTADDAAELAASDPYQFQWWALGLIGARPAEGKKGADHGIDGRLFFFDDDAKPKQVIVSVKAGKVQVSHVRDLVGVLDRESAQIGVLISLNEPTSPMRQEAASAGFYTSLGHNYPRVQLLTVGDLLGDKRIEMPVTGPGGTAVALPPTPEETHPDQMSLGS